MMDGDDPMPALLTDAFRAAGLEVETVELMERGVEAVRPLRRALRRARKKPVGE